MTTLERVSSDSSSGSQHDGVFQLPNFSISHDKTRQYIANTYLESRHSAPEVDILRSAGEVNISVKDWTLSSTLSQSERKPAYLLTPGTSRPALSASPSPAQNFTDFGNRLQTEANDQNRAAKNRASYDKFRTRSARYDRESSVVRRNSVQEREGIAATLGQDDEDEEDDSPPFIKPGRYFDALDGPELDKIRVRDNFLHLYHHILISLSDGIYNV